MAGGRGDKPHHLAVRAGKNGRRRVGQAPLRQHPLQRRRLVFRHVGGDVGRIDGGAAAEGLGVRRVEDAVVDEIGVQRETAEARRHARLGEQGREDSAHIQEHGRPAVRHAVEQAHHLIDEQRAGRARIGPDERDALVGRAAGQPRDLHIILHLDHEAGHRHGGDEADRRRRVRVDHERGEVLRHGFTVDIGENGGDVVRRQVRERRHDQLVAAVQGVRAGVAGRDHLRRIADPLHQPAGREQLRDATKRRPEAVARERMAGGALAGEEGLPLRDHRRIR